MEINKSTTQEASPSNDSLYCPPKYEIPRDERDPSFVKSFSCDQVDEYKKFFEEFGFVIVRDVLTEEECKRSIDDIWEYIEKKGWIRPGAFCLADSDYPINRNDPSTWDNGWPAMANEGIVGTPPIFTKGTLMNRQNEKLYQVHANLYGTPRLMVNHDRYGLFRPTRGVEMENPKTGKTEKQNMPNWETMKNLHFDMNPWNYVANKDPEKSEKTLAILRYKRNTGDFIVENNEVGTMAANQLHLQTLVNFMDNRVEDGGFQIVPGFRKHLVQWVNERKQKSNALFVVLPSSEPIQQLALRLSCRAGSVIIWDQRTAHGSAPNASNRPRYCQFFKFFPAIPLDTDRAKSRAEVLQKKIDEANFRDQLTPLGRKLFGLESW